MLPSCLYDALEIVRLSVSQQTFTIFKWQNKFQLSVGGLLSLHRQGDITFEADSPKISARLAVNDIDVKFRYLLSWRHPSVSYICGVVLKFNFEKRSALLPKLVRLLMANSMNRRYKMRTFGLPSQGRLNMTVNNIAMILRASLQGVKTQLDHFEVSEVSLRWIVYN